MNTDELHDDVRQAIRDADKEKAIMYLRELLRGVERNAVPALLEELSETAAWEIQCGADPIIGYQFLAEVNKRAGDGEGVENCMKRAAAYRELQNKGVDIRDITACCLYIEQANWETHDLSQEERVRFENSIAYRRQERLLSSIVPLLEHFPGAAWLTVGDGRHALEARFIQGKGSRAMPSDVTDTVLKCDKETGLIDDYAVARVDALPFPDKSFDFVLAKDMLHHAARPWLGLFEMLRVAAEGICFIEPYDHSFFHSILTPLMSREQQGKAWHNFEDWAANYIYSFTDREVSKFCMGLGLPFLACKGFSDYYEPEFDRLEAPRGGVPHMHLEKILAERETKAANREGSYELAAYVILKRPVKSALRIRFEEDGFFIVDLPRNKALEKTLLNFVRING